ncbi:MAG TPA: FecR family protein [Terracidiphilus sp.]|nr:FecR family protein [Terracidiphilus sp.]
MTPSLSSVATASLSILLFASILPAQTADSASPSPGVSRVRIVRLSEVKGAVELDRNIGRGFETVMPNMPIVENSRLRTEVGTAEVEFEDNSTLRLAPNSMAEFPQLERLAAGGTVSSVRLEKGTAYVSLLKSKTNEFNLLVGDQKLQLLPDSHIRLQMDGPEANLAVLDGTVQVSGPAGVQDVHRKETLTFQMTGQEQPTLAKNIVSEPFDSWDKDSTQYHSRVASLSAFGNSPYSYGLNDMAYYGSFMDAGGCGMMWQPYFVSANWSPFSNGAWAFYPGAGYSWVSPYPWGWTPYHYGSWSFCPGYGYGWMPGGAWTGLNNGTILMSRVGSSAPGRLLPSPVHPLRPGEPSMLPVNLKPLVRSQVASADSFVFRNNSAGLGIPRDELGKLGKLSRQTEEHGTASTHIYVSVAPAGSYGRGAQAGSTLAPVAIHRGSAPSYEPSYSSRGGASPNPGYSAGNSGGGGASYPAPSAPSASHPSAGGGGRPH